MRQYQMVAPRLFRATCNKKWCLICARIRLSMILRKWVELPCKPFRYNTNWHKRRLGAMALHGLDTPCVEGLTSREEDDKPRNLVSQHNRAGLLFSYVGMQWGA